ncbi:MAG: LEVG family PEP-CTERM protein [Limnospira sp.]
MKFKSIASLIAITAATLSFVAPAQAETNFVPEQEGEIDVGLGVLDSSQSLALSLFPFIESIESLDDSFTGQKSRLFVDTLSTKSEYGDDVILNKKDAGTNHSSYWFRPSDTRLKNGELVEDGQLEVGTFKFTFTQTLKELNIDFFDIDYVYAQNPEQSTSIIGLNGSEVFDLMPKTGNNGVFSKTLYDVDSVTLKLGGFHPRWEGDGVNFRMSATTVPEPATLGGLAVVGLAFAGQKLRKGRKA